MYRDAAVFPCTCGELLYAERVHTTRVTRIRHGENPECARDFPDKVMYEQPDAVADWYEEVHAYALREKKQGNPGL